MVKSLRPSPSVGLLAPTLVDSVIYTTPSSNGIAAASLSPVEILECLSTL